MPLVATLAGANANSYVTLTEAESYFATRLRTEAWTNASSADREKALVMACQQIESLRLRVHRRPYGFPSEPIESMNRNWDPLAPVNADQALSFPRRKDRSSNGSMMIPSGVKAAQCEVALALLTHGTEAERRQALQAAGVTSFTVDGLSESYAANTGQTLLSLQARTLMAPFIERGGVIATSELPDGEYSPGSMM